MFPQPLGEHRATSVSVLELRAFWAAFWARARVNDTFPKKRRKKAQKAHGLFTLAEILNHGRRGSRLAG